MWAVFPLLLRAFHGWAYDYVVNFVSCFPLPPPNRSLVTAAVRLSQQISTQLTQPPPLNQIKPMKVDPIDNFIHRGTEAFLTGAAPDGTRYVFSVCV